MATAEEYAAWIVKNKDKRGTPEFDTVARAYQMAKGATPKPAEQAPNPTEGQSWLQNAAAGMGQAFTNVGRGIGHVVGAVSQEDIDEAKRLDAPLDKAPGSTVGNIAGNIAAFAPTALIPGANTVTGAALYGGIANALATPGQFPERGFAGLMGAAGGAAGQALPRVIKALRAGAEPLTDAGKAAIAGRTMNRAAGDAAPDVAQRLSTAAPLIPGSQPTAAEVGESGGIAALQRAMSAADPEAYTHRGMQQASARTQALRGIAQDDSARAAAVALRESTTKPMYTAAASQEVPVDKALMDLLARPSAKQAFARAEKIAQEQGRQFGFTATKQAPASPILNAAGAPMTPAYTVPGKVTGQTLQDLKMGMDALLKDPTSGIAGKEADLVKATRGELMSWMEGKIPQLGTARTTYRDMSRPINQMDVGSDLLKKIEPALNDYGALARETGNKYATALRNSDQTVRAATGTKAAGGLTDVMDPGQIQTLEGIAKDLARKANAQDLGRGVGSNTYQNFAMDNLSDSMGVPSAVKAVGGMIPGLSPTATMLAKGAQAVGGMAYKNSDELIRKKMAEALLNPQLAAQMMTRAAQPSALVKALRNMPGQKAIPPEEMLRVLQAIPGLTGAGALPALANSGQ